MRKLLPQKRLKTPYFREQDKGEPHLRFLAHVSTNGIPVLRGII